MWWIVEWVGSCLWGAASYLWDTVCGGFALFWWVVDSFAFVLALVAVIAGVFFLKRKQFDESVTSKRIAERVEQEYAAALLRRIHDVDNPVVVEQEAKGGSGAATSGGGGGDSDDDELSDTSRASLDGTPGERDKKKGLFSKLGSSANAGVDFITRKKKSDNE